MHVLNIFDVESGIGEAGDGGKGLFGHEKGRGAWRFGAEVDHLNFDDVGLARAVSPAQAS